MKKYLLFYKECIKVSFATASTYRANFLINTFIMVVSNLLFPFVTILIYQSGASFPDWSFYEVLLIQSIFILSTGVSNMLFNGILWATMGNIVNGSFEIILIKPIDTLFYIISSTIEIDGIGLILGGGVMFGISIAHIEAISMLMWLQFILLFLAGILVMFGISLIMAATSFKWVGNSRIPQIFDSIKTFGKYPQNIFSKVIINATSFIIPVAMIGFFPASALLSKSTLAMFIAVLPCIIFAMVGVMLYKYMIHLYEGAGG